MTGDKRIVVVHYDEIALKGKNQKFFVDKLIENIKNNQKVSSDK